MLFSEAKVIIFDNHVLLKKTITYLLGISLLFCSSFRFISKPEELNYKMHAMFIYHFTKYINWPEKETNEDFVIGIIGQTPLKDELISITKSKNINNKKVGIKQIKENSEDLKRCQIIFIAENESKSINNVIAITEKSAVLVITEKSGMLKKGAAINFLVIDEKLRFEISKTKLAQHNLKVSNELLKLASDVQ